MPSPESIIRSEINTKHRAIIGFVLRRNHPSSLEEDDMISEAGLSMYRSITKYRPNPKGPSPYSYLCNRARFAALRTRDTRYRRNQHRKLQLIPHYLPEMRPFNKTESMDPSLLASREQLTASIYNHNLSNAERTVIETFYVHERKLVQAARFLNVTPNTITRIHKHALAKIRQNIEDEKLANHLSTGRPKMYGRTFSNWMAITDPSWKKKVGIPPKNAVKTPMHLRSRIRFLTEKLQYVYPAGIMDYTIEALYAIFFELEAECIMHYEHAKQWHNLRSTAAKEEADA